MNLQRDVLRQRIAKLRSVVRHLRELAELDRTSFLDSTSDQWAAERGLQLAAEAVFGVGSHILVSRFNETPDDYESIVSLLGRRGVLDDELVDRLEGLGGFRNILVHDYLEVDGEQVYDYLDSRFEDFVEFAYQIEDFLERAD